MKKYDYSMKMSKDIIHIDSLTFKDISITPEELSLRIRKNKSYELFVKYIDDIPAGFIGIMYVSTPHYEAAWIDLLAVIPEFQGKGLGKAMIDYVKCYLCSSDKNVEFISALIRGTNYASLGAAKAQGFSEDGKGDFKLLFCDM